MPTVIGVRFRPATKIYYFNPYGILDIKVDDRIIVETGRGVELGIVVMPMHNVPVRKIEGRLKRVIRRATSVDLMQTEMYRAKETTVQKQCGKIATRLKIPLKVVQAEYSFDGSRLVLSFIANNRPDTKRLVRELSRKLRTRVDVRQVRLRDETKVLGGYGRCGRPLCCASWMTEFHPVSIKMAKQQGLPLSPSEISGVCGRLLCCLAYEDAVYAEIKKSLPKVGSQVKTEDGITATVRGLNIIKETVILAIEGEDSYVEQEADKLEFVISKPVLPDKKSEKRKRSKKW